MVYISLASRAWPRLAPSNTMERISRAVANPMDQVRKVVSRAGDVLHKGVNVLSPWQHTFLAYDFNAETYTDLGIHADVLADALNKAILTKAERIAGSDTEVTIDMTTPPDAVLNAWFLVYHSVKFGPNSIDATIAAKEASPTTGNTTLYPIKGHPNFAILEFGTDGKSLVFIDGPVTQQGAAFGRGLAAFMKTNGTALSEEISKFNGQVSAINKQGLRRATKYLLYVAGVYTLWHSLSVPGLKKRVYQMERRVESDVKSDYNAFKNATRNATGVAWG